MRACSAEIAARETRRLTPRVSLAAAISLALLQPVSTVSQVTQIDSATRMHDRRLFTRPGGGDVAPWETGEVLVP